MVLLLLSCCDKMPSKSKLKEKGFVLAHSSRRTQSAIGWDCHVLWPQEGKAALQTASAARKEKEEPQCSAHCLLFIHLRTPAIGSSRTSVN